MVCIYNNGTLFIEKRKFCLFLTIWTENIMLRKINQGQKNTECSHLYPQSKTINRSRMGWK